MKHRAKTPMTPEQQQVIDRMMAGAIKAWDADLIKAAVESGANPQELLVRAIVKKSPEFVTLAVDYGADLSALVPASDRKYQTILHHAHDNFSEPVVEALLAKGVSIDQQNPQGETVAQRAARSGDFDRMRWYIAKGAHPTGLAQDILFKGIEKKDLPAMRWAVSNGADVKGRVRDGEVMQTALHVALANFREDIIDYLIDNGVSVNARNSAGETPLQLAARGNDIKKVEYLVRKGGDPLLRAYNGLSPLDEALKNVETSDRDYSYSSSYNQRAKDGKAVLTLLLNKVTEVHGLEPYNTAVQRDITVNKPISVQGKKPDAP